MVTHSDHPEDVNELERRLSAWQPSLDGLDADAVLFAAGRASVRSRATRFAWPALTALMTSLVVVLGLWLKAERNERQVLAGRLQERPPALPTRQLTLPVRHHPPAAHSAPGESADPDEAAPDSYLASRRALEKGLEAWPNRVVVRGGPADPSLTNPPILTLGQRDALLDP